MCYDDYDIEVLRNNPWETESDNEENFSSGEKSDSTDSSDAAPIYENLVGIRDVPTLQSGNDTDKETLSSVREEAESSPQLVGPIQNSNDDGIILHGIPHITGETESSSEDDRIDVDIDVDIDVLKGHLLRESGSYSCVREAAESLTEIPMQEDITTVISYSGVD